VRGSSCVRACEEAGLARPRRAWLRGGGRVVRARGRRAHGLVGLQAGAPSQVFMLRLRGRLLSKSPGKGQHRPRGEVRHGRALWFRRPASRIGGHPMPLGSTAAALRPARPLTPHSLPAGKAGGTMREQRDEAQEHLRPSLQVPSELCPAGTDRPGACVCNTCYDARSRHQRPRQRPAPHNGNELRPVDGRTHRARVCVQGSASSSACNRRQGATAGSLWTRWCRGALQRER